VPLRKCEKTANRLPAEIAAFVVETDAISTPFGSGGEEFVEVIVVEVHSTLDCTMKDVQRRTGVDLDDPFPLFVCVPPGEELYFQCEDHDRDRTTPQRRA